MLFTLLVSSFYASTLITTPFEYDEYFSLSPVTIRWFSSDSNIDHYIISVRKFTITQRISMYNNSISPNNTIQYGTSIISNLNVGTANSYVINQSMLENKAMYKYVVATVYDDGSTIWSNPRYFYIGSCRINNEPIAFNIWTGFTEETKEHIYYAANEWNTQLNGIYVTTYPFSQGISNTSSLGDGINAITCIQSEEGYTMVTYKLYTTSNILLETDINVNRAVQWTNGSEVGKYDIQSSMTHEFGHVIGLCDKYEQWSGSWTMYGIGITNSINKRSLEYYDINDAITFYGGN